MKLASQSFNEYKSAQIHNLKQLWNSNKATCMCYCLWNIPMSSSLSWEPPYCGLPPTVRGPSQPMLKVNRWVYWFTDGIHVLQVRKERGGPEQTWSSEIWNKFKSRPNWCLPWLPGEYCVQLVCTVSRARFVKGSKSRENTTVWKQWT